MEARSTHKAGQAEEGGSGMRFEILIPEDEGGTYSLRIKGVCQVPISRFMISTDSGGRETRRLMNIDLGGIRETAI